MAKLKISRVTYIILFLLLASLMLVTLPNLKVQGQSVGNSQMINGVLAHQMSAAQAQLLESSNITWVSADVTFNPADFTQWSQIYNLAKQYHLSLLGILDQHLMNYSNTFTLSDWDAAVKAAVAAYGDIVKTWEIWNEPIMPGATLGYFDGSPKAYDAMLQTAYNDIKTAAPSDTVIGLGGMPLYDSENTTIDFYAQQGIAWTTQVVQLGGMNYCDAIAVHAYPYGQYYPFIAGSYFQTNFQNYTQLCNKPVWVTEVGTESQSTTWAATPALQSTFLSQTYALFQSLGAKAYFWYELGDNIYSSSPDSNFGLFDNGGNQKPAFAAYVNEVNGAASPTATPTAPPTPQSTPIPTTKQTANPTPGRSSLQSPTTQPNPSDNSSTTATPVPEENWAVALIAAVAILIVTTASIFMKRRSSEKIPKNQTLTCRIVD